MIDLSINHIQHDSAARKMERELRIGQEYSTNPEMMQRWLKDMAILRVGMLSLIFKFKFIILQKSSTQRRTLWRPATI